MSKGLELRLLGLPVVLIDGMPCRLPTRKALALVAVLALEGRTARSTLATLLWSELGEDTARKNLRQELHRLADTPLGAFVRLERDAIGLIGPLETDVALFRAQVTHKAWTPALETYRGPLLGGLELKGASGFEDWLSNQRENLEREYAEVLEQQTVWLEGEGELRGAVGSRRVLLSLDPLQERHHREAIRLYTALGERAEALAQFERCRAMLSLEFGLEPLPETVAEAERARIGVAPAPALAVVSVPLATLRLAPPLVGRNLAWQRLERALERGTPVVVCGEAGVGKSRLMGDFAAAQRGLSQGGADLGRADLGRAYLGRGQPFDAGVPFATLSRDLRVWLERGADPKLPLWVRRELARLVPELSPEASTPLSSAADRLRLFDAFTHFLEGRYRQGELLLLEDLHDFDASSLEMSLYACAQLAGRGVFQRAVATVRLEVLDPVLRASLEVLLRSGQLERLDLEPLGEVEVAELIETLSGQPSTLFPRRLWQATGGNPFFLLETVRGLFERGELHSLPQGGWATPYDEATEDYRELPLPASVRETVLSRVGRLGEVAQRVLDVASLSAEPLDPEVLAGASALGRWEALGALERALEAGLLREDAQGYRFVHDLVRRSLATHLGEARRRLIHRQLAGGLEAAHGPPSRIAHHLERAGCGLEAAQWSLKAADEALSVYAGLDALAHLERALTLLPPSDPQHFEVLARFVRVGYELEGRERIRPHLEALERLATTPAQRALAAHLGAILLAQEGHDAGVIAAYTQARDLYQAANDEQGRCRTNTNLAITAYEMGQFEQAEGYIRVSLELALPLGPDRLGMAQVWHGAILAARGWPEAALSAYREAHALLSAASSPYARLQADCSLAASLALYGAFAAALDAADRAIEAAVRLGSQMMETFSLEGRARALRGLGRLTEAQRDLEVALTAARSHLGERDFLGSCLRGMVRLHLDAGRPAAALEASEEALTLLRPSGPRCDRVLTLTLRSAARLALGHVQPALEDSSEALALLEGLEGLREAHPASVYLAHLRALRAVGQPQQATALLERAAQKVLEASARIKDPALRADFLALPEHRTLLERT